jgi:hypothetical protein
MSFASYQAAPPRSLRRRLICLCLLKVAGDFLVSFHEPRSSENFTRTRCSIFCVSFGCGGALPPFPTPTEPAILYPILRMTQFVSLERVQLYALKANVDKPRTSLPVKSEQYRGLRKGGLNRCPPKAKIVQFKQSRARSGAPVAVTGWHQSKFLVS